MHGPVIAAVTEIHLGAYSPPITNTITIMPVKEPSYSSAANDEKLIEYALSSHEYIDQFIPIIRSELLNHDSLDDLIDKLETISTTKEETLQDISFHSIDDITSSVEVINGIINSSDTISKQVMNMSRNLNKSGKLLLEERKKVSAISQTRQRIEDTSNKINSCLDVLNLTNKVLELIRTEDFYRSLILLQSLSSDYGKEFSTFAFIHKFIESIPSFKLMIVDETFNQLNRWLNLSVEKNLTDFGELLFEHFQAVNENWFEKQAENSNLITFKVNSAVEKSFRSNKLRTFDLFDKLSVDIEPLLHAILVFQELKQFNDLKEYFANDILRRVDHLFMPIKDSINKLNVFSSNESLRINLFSICSFPIIDKYMNEKTNYRLRSIDEINSTYSSIMSKFLPILSNHIEYSEFELGDLVELNDILGLYYQVLSYHNFNCDAVYKLMLKVFGKFNEKLIEDFKKKYLQKSNHDNSQSMVIESPKEFTQITNEVFYIFHVKNPSFPMNVPFSGIYLDSCRLLKDFIYQLYEFISRYYVNDNNVIISRISRSIDEVLINVILKDLDDKINSTYKEVVSQNLINLDFYSSSIYEIEKYLNYSDDDFIARSRSYSNLVKLNAIDYFKKTRRLAIESMFNMIEGKVHSLFDMVDFEWNSDEYRQDPNTSLVDLIEFLQDSFKLNFSHLPESIKSLLLLKIMDKIAKFLNDSILESESLTIYSVQNFQNDIAYIKSSIARFYDSNINIDDSSLEPLKNLFTKLKQIAELLSEGNLDNYKNDETRIRKFNKIDIEEAVILINKLPSIPTSPGDEEGEDTFASAPSSSGDQDDSKSIFGLKRSATFMFRKQ